MIYGMMFGLCLAVVVGAWVQSIRRYMKYERAVRGWLGADADWYFDHDIMIDFMMADMGADAAAREMIAVNIEP